MYVRRISFAVDNLSKNQWIFTKFGILIFWRSGLGLLLGKFHQILTELPAREMPIFSFLDDNSSKRQWIFTKLGMCIDIVEIWSGITNGQILSKLDRVICPRLTHIFVSGQ